MTETQIPVTGVDKRIIAFIQSQTVLTLATSADNVPYCATCFYAYSAKHNALVFKSSPDTIHVLQGLGNANVAGSILPDKLVTGKIKGVQFSGAFAQVADPDVTDLQKVYYKKYPFAMAMGGELWVVKLKWIKFTDNTLGFGKKLTWEI